MSIIRSQIKGCGGYLPERIMSNHELAKLVDTSDEWIVERTGIKQRHIAAEGEKTSDMAIIATERALDAAGLLPTDIDLIILATTTPDETLPASATVVQAAIGMEGGFALDVQAVCSGFIYGMSIADNFIKAGQVKRAVVVGSETFSRILDWEDRGTCILFGDGAGAVILEAGEGDGSTKDCGILTAHLHSDGHQHDLLYTDGGPSSTQTVGHLRMRGREVFRKAVVNLTSVVHEALDAVGLETSDIDWLVPHQANQRILDSTAKKLGLSPDRMIVTLSEHANTSAASVPLALSVAVEDGRIKKGDLVLMEAMGGGFTWGALIVRW